MKIVFARQSFIAGTVTVVGGQHWPADDPIVEAFPHLFTDDPRFGLSYSRPPVEEKVPEKPVESASAAPGEKRSVKRGG